MSNSKDSGGPTSRGSEESGKSADSEVIPGRTQFGTRYPKAYKLRILALADRCTAPGEIGKLLRQEGLMHCTLTAFRKQRAAGYLDPVAKRSDETDQTRRVMDLERENRRLKRKLEQAVAVIEVQKKVSSLLEAFDALEPKDSSS